MVKPTAGCQTCKIRRIKCDNTKPVCMRCAKSRRICLETSAVKAACFEINIENNFASGVVKRPRGPRSSLTIWRPQIDLPTRAIAYYMKYHLQLPRTTPFVLGGLVECVSTWQASGRTSSIVDLAISSIALAVFSKTQRHPPAMAEADSTYRQLLRSAQDCIMQVDISNSGGHSVDACLLAILVMGRYEGVVHCSKNVGFEGSFRSLRSWFHHDGSLAVLKQWYDHADRSAATTIIKQVRRGLIKSTILREIPLPIWILNGGDFGEEGLGLDFDQISTQLIMLRGGLVMSRSPLSSCPEPFYRISQAAGHLDQRLQVWISQVSTLCECQQHVLAEVVNQPTKHLYSSTVYTFSNPAYAGLWAQYFSMRMLISSTHIALMERFAPRPLYNPKLQALKQQLLDRMQTMADGLASTIPFCLGRLQCSEQTLPDHKLRTLPNANADVPPHTASLVVWPLTIASCLTGLNPRQLEWFRSELAYMGDITGDGILTCAVTDQWAVL